VRSSIKEEVVDAPAALKRLRERYEMSCGKPFSLPPEFDSNDVANIDGRIELYPWEYEREVRSEREVRTVTFVSPVKWLITYASGSNLSQLRQALAGKGERREDDIRQFVINALAVDLVLSKFPGIGQLLKDLRYDLRVDKHPELGNLQVVTINATLRSFCPSDEIILSAIRLSGVPAFVELIDFGALDSWSDPLLTSIREQLR
jgi:hypothetical protein